MAATCQGLRPENFKGQSQQPLRNPSLRAFSTSLRRLAGHHETIARIEVDQEDMALFLQPELREKLVANMRALGYLYVTLDLAGFQTGSLNAALKPKAVKDQAGV